MREHFIEQTAWAAVIIMSWINILRLEQLRQSDAYKRQ